MSSLYLRIDKYLDGQLRPAPRIPGTVYRLGKKSKKSRLNARPQQVQIPLSADPDEVSRITLSPGRYFVETVLPSGETLADSVELRRGQTQSLVLKGTSSPNEWFSWQHLAGNTRRTPERVTPDRRRKGAWTKSRIFRTIASDAGLTEKQVSSVVSSLTQFMAQSLRQHGEFTLPEIATLRTVRKPYTKARQGVNPFTGEKLMFKSKPASKLLNISPSSRLEKAVNIVDVESDQPDVAIGQPIKVISVSTNATGPSNDDCSRIWPTIVAPYGGATERSIRRLSSSTREHAIAPRFYDSDRAVYRINSQEAHEFRSRSYAIVTRKHSDELVCLPMPWLSLRGRRSTIEIGVQKPRSQDIFCTSATVIDDRLGTLVGYLSSGSLEIAREIAETAKEMLYWKTQNPYAAAAGGYALVGTAREAHDLEWHSWIRNLAQWFPLIPDGAIQFAQLNLRMRRNLEDIEQARIHFKKAYKRGLPFFSMGLKWLMEGLEWFSSDDAEAATMLTHVREIAWRTNFQQAFTIVKIGD